MLWPKRYARNRQLYPSRSRIVSASCAPTSASLIEGLSVRSRSRFISACVLSLSLSGCLTLRPVVNPQENLMVKVPMELPQMTDGTGATLGETMKTWASYYHECRIRQHGLVDAIRGTQ